jgi:hypothetical protein
MTTIEFALALDCNFHGRELPELGKPDCQNRPHFPVRYFITLPPFVDPGPLLPFLAPPPPVPLCPSIMAAIVAAPIIRPARRSGNSPAIDVVTVSTDSATPTSNTLYPGNSGIEHRTRENRSPEAAILPSAAIQPTKTTPASMPGEDNLATSQPYLCLPEATTITLSPLPTQFEPSATRQSHRLPPTAPTRTAPQVGDLPRSNPSTPFWTPPYDRLHPSTGIVTHSAVCQSPPIAGGLMTVSKYSQG